jgi:predicted kinase
MCNALDRSTALASLAPEPRFVVMMCGVAGSGKTTFSLDLEAKGFARVSIDEELWREAGRYGVDYAPEDYAAKLIAARSAVAATTAKLLAQGRAIVVDSSFWSRAHRDEFAQLIERAGGQRRLVFLKASEGLLRERLERRSERFDANAALPIDDETLARFLVSFEEPGPDEAPLVVAA